MIIYKKGMSKVQVINYFKTAYGGLSKPIWLLSAAMFINRSGTMVFPFLSLYLTQYLHFSIADTGVILIIYGLGAVTGTYMGGFLIYFSTFVSGVGHPESLRDVPAAAAQCRNKP